MYKRKIKVRNCVGCGCECHAIQFHKPIGETRCRSCSTKGSRAPNWKGGQVLKDGYVLINKPEHHRANCDGHVNRSHLVWEAANGRHIQPGEVIHHIDGSRDNDAIENLQLMTNGAHMSLHNSGKNHGNYKDGKRVGERAKQKKRREDKRKVIDNG